MKSHHLHLILHLGWSKTWSKIDSEVSFHLGPIRTSVEWSNLPLAEIRWYSMPSHSVTLERTMHLVWLIPTSKVIPTVVDNCVMNQHLLEWHWFGSPHFLVKICYEVKFPLTPPLNIVSNTESTPSFSISNLYCQTPRQKVEIGAITNIAPATLESIQLSLDTALGTWKNHSELLGKVE